MKITTTELPLAAALHSLGYTPLLERVSGGKYYFVFDSLPEVENAVADYWNNELTVNPKLLWNSVRELKSRMAMFHAKDVEGRHE